MTVADREVGDKLADSGISKLGGGSGAVKTLTLKTHTRRLRIFTMKIIFFCAIDPSSFLRPILYTELQSPDLSWRLTPLWSLCK